MPQSERYSFRKVTRDDLPLLAAWRSQPHVREWWGAAKPEPESFLSDSRVARWMVSTVGRPFAFLQDYSVHGWENHHFAALPNGSRGIDLFIGDPEMIGAGHGAGLAQARMQRLFDEGAPVIATDPHPENARAIAVYKKLGFRPIGPVQKTQWGLILPMTTDRLAD